MARQNRFLGAKTAIMLAILFAVAAGFINDLYFSVPPQRTATEIVSADRPIAPDFAFTDLKGARHNLKDFRGKIVILDFWASWCAPCVEQFPHLVRFAAARQDDVALIALSSDTGPAFHDFMRRQSAETLALLGQSSIHVALDESRRITRDLFLTEKYPETIVIDRAGRMARKFVGGADWTSARLAAYFAALQQK